MLELKELENKPFSFLLQLYPFSIWEIRRKEVLMANFILTVGIFAMIGLTVTVVFMVNWLGEKIRDRVNK